MKGQHHAGHQGVHRDHVRGPRDDQRHAVPVRHHAARAADRGQAAEAHPALGSTDEAGPADPRPRERRLPALLVRGLRRPEAYSLGRCCLGTTEVGQAESLRHRPLPLSEVQQLTDMRIPMHPVWGRVNQHP